MYYVYSWPLNNARFGVLTLQMFENLCITYSQPAASMVPHVYSSNCGLFCIVELTTEKNLHKVDQRSSNLCSSRVSCTHTHTHTHTHTYITYSNFVSHLNIPTRIRSSLETDLKLNYGKASSYTPLQIVLSKGDSFSFFNFYLHWSTVDLQCCTSFRCIA